MSKTDRETLDRYFAITGRREKDAALAAALAQISTLQVSLAAAEGERDALAARLAEGERVIAPFAAAAEAVDSPIMHSDGHAWESPMAMLVTYGDFRAARSFLTPTGEGKP